MGSLESPIGHIPLGGSLAMGAPLIVAGCCYFYYALSCRARVTDSALVFYALLGAVCVLLGAALIVGSLASATP